VIGDPPAGATNPIRFTWEADGFTEGGQTIGAGEDANQAIAGPDRQQTSGGEVELTGGAARIRDALPAATEDDRSFLRNLAEHEFVHILGTGDDPAGSVTAHEQGSGARTLNDADLRE